MSHWYVAAWGETELDEFGDWWRDLSTGQQASLSACIELLEFHPTQIPKAESRNATDARSSTLRCCTMIVAG